MAFREVTLMLALLSDPLSQLHGIFGLSEQFWNHPFSPKFFHQLLLIQQLIEKSLNFRHPLYTTPDHRLCSLCFLANNTIFHTFSLLWSCHPWEVTTWNLNHYLNRQPYLLSSGGKSAYLFLKIWNFSVLELFRCMVSRIISILAPSLWIVFILIVSHLNMSSRSTGLVSHPNMWLLPISF